MALSAFGFYRSLSWYYGLENKVQGTVILPSQTSNASAHPFKARPKSWVLNPGLIALSQEIGWV